MKNDLPCFVVQDLLPHYAEDLTSDQTNQLIKSHLDHCKSCQSTYEALQRPLPMEPDSRAVNFFKKAKRRSMQKALAAAIGTFLICVFLCYIFVIIQYPFHFSVQNLYRLSNGSLYFELAADGRESSVSGVSFQERVSDDATEFEIHMGYSLFALLQNEPSDGETRRYAFVFSMDDMQNADAMEKIVYRQGGTELLVWDRTMDMEIAPDVIEDIAKTIVHPYTIVDFILDEMQ